MLPLNYATLKLFADGDQLDVAAVMDRLKPSYGSFRSFKFRAIQESLMSAEKNDLLERTSFELDEDCNLRVYYRASEYGLRMIAQYIRE